MTLLMQTLLGSVVLGMCSLLHISLIAVTVRGLRHVAEQTTAKWISHWITLVMVGFGAVVLVHAIHVWLWALIFVALGALPDIENAIYFSLVTYTTVGYGDVTISPDFRVFAAMAAVTGLLNFGLSTAFLVALVSRFMARL